MHSLGGKSRTRLRTGQIVSSLRRNQHRVLPNWGAISFHPAAQYNKDIEIVNRNRGTELRKPIPVTYHRLPLLSLHHGGLIRKKCPGRSYLPSSVADHWLRQPTFHAACAYVDLCCPYLLRELSAAASLCLVALVCSSVVRK
ncbi:hypothetical protein BDZ97DRAFT_1124782 [Flammula alnicola]|nr:hypothetical protein BDZ97DRAFT_1124782 [Flammula alnicola]